MRALVTAAGRLARHAAAGKSEAEQRLVQFRAIRAELAADPHTEHHPYWLLTISAGEHTARAAIAWADESLAALDQLK